MDSHPYTLLPLLFLLMISLTVLTVTADDPPTYPECHKEDEKALIALRDSVSGGTGNPFASWNSSISRCCEWYGVVCDPKTFRIRDLTIVQNDLVRTIPPAIGGFPTLQLLMLHKLPNLAGTIPIDITRLHNLRFLSISWTSVSGPVPAFISQLKNLDNLDLSFNRLTGSIPPELGYLPNLNAIDISRNNLTGTIPSTLFAAAKGSEPYLILSHNGLTGSIPRALGGVNFSTIDLSRNHLTGDASFLFGVGKGVTYIDLSRNQLAFDFSTVVFPLIGLVNVDLSHNMIYGGIPANIVHVTNNNFNFFNVSYNRLCGRIPTGDPMSQFDASTYIHNKCLCGTPLPPCK